jgi:hypothetical protein
MSVNDAMNELVRRLGDDAALRARAHEGCAEAQRRHGLILGIIEVALSAAIGTTVVIAAVQNTQSHSLVYMGLGFVLIAQPLIARLGAFFNNPVHVDRHTRSSVAFYELNRTIALHLADPESSSLEKLKRLVDRANRDFAAVSATAIPLTLRSLRNAQERLAEERRLEAQLRYGTPQAAPAVRPWKKAQSFLSMLMLPAIATTVIPFLIISSLSPHQKLAAIAVVFALALVFGSSWQLSDTERAEQRPWSNLLGRIGTPITVGVIMIIGTEMLLVLMSEPGHMSDRVQAVYDFTRMRAGWVKAGVLGLYAVAVALLISKWERRWKHVQMRSVVGRPGESLPAKGQA